ncbi:sugar porter family MFS transporter [Mycobacterium tilburgii]|uniref:sugar porter family MFS transporter n=1 Tax=Mycobacterium tilburgii TaxID=44467 RepID=UPI0021B16756|nr:sugar porter family MFS transporter [Mycobacterium tilburgii]
MLILVEYAAFALLGAFSVALPMLLTARLLLDLTTGVMVVVVPVYVAESAPAAVRGALLTTYQLTIVTGLIVGYLTGYLLADTHSWRWMLGLAAAPTILLVPLTIRLPDTARWYLMKGRVEDARRTLLRVEPAANAECGARRDRRRIARRLPRCQRRHLRDAAARRTCGLPCS